MVAKNSMTGGNFLGKDLVSLVVENSMMRVENFGKSWFGSGKFQDGSGKFLGKDLPVVSLVVENSMVG